MSSSERLVGSSRVIVDSSGAVRGCSRSLACNDGISYLGGKFQWLKVLNLTPALTPAFRSGAISEAVKARRASRWELCCKWDITGRRSAYSGRPLAFSVIGAGGFDRR